MKKVNPTLQKGYTFPRRIKQYMQGCDRDADNKIKSEYARGMHTIQRRRQIKTGARSNGKILLLCKKGRYIVILSQI